METDGQPRRRHEDGRPAHHRHGDGRSASSSPWRRTASPSSPWRRTVSLVVAMETDGQPIIAMETDGQPIIAMETDGQPRRRHGNGWSAHHHHGDGRPAHHRHGDGRSASSSRRYLGRRPEPEDCHRRRKVCLLGKSHGAPLSLPHSNADCERTFLMVRKVHTEARKSLHADTITAFLRCKINYDCHCYDFAVTPAMLRGTKT